MVSIFIFSNLFGQDKKQKLYVFVGEKIEVKEFKPKVKEGTILMDQAFKAKYKILKNVYGDLKQDSIEFVAYDHYGIPPFSKHKYVLLYIVKEGENLYHSKYQFSALYKTKENKWAGIYSKYDYGHSFNKNTSIKPEKINFEPIVEIDLKESSKETISKWYPKPYFYIKDNKAIAVYGNYINELFQLKKDGVLKARGYFK